MGSFYGNFGGSGGGGGGTTNYDELSNKPIVNLQGLPSNPIILYNLDVGEYIVKGYYKYNNIEKEVYDITSLKITVAIDRFTQQKNIYYTSIENSEYVIYDVIYNKNDEDYHISRFANGGSEEEGIIFVEQLPPITEGKLNVLYVTKDSIYRYMGNEYILLSSSAATESWGVF